MRNDQWVRIPAYVKRRTQWQSVHHFIKIVTRSLYSTNRSTLIRANGFSVTGNFNITNTVGHTIEDGANFTTARSMPPGSDVVMATIAIIHGEQAASIFERYVDPSTCRRIRPKNFARNTEKHLVSNDLVSATRQPAKIATSSDI